VAVQTCESIQLETSGGTEVRIVSMVRGSAVVKIVNGRGGRLVDLAVGSVVRSTRWAVSDVAVTGDGGDGWIGRIGSIYTFDLETRPVE
jgi:hypothetical protein